MSSSSGTPCIRGGAGRSNMGSQWIRWSTKDLLKVNKVNLNTRVLSCMMRYYIVIFCHTYKYFYELLFSSDLISNKTYLLTEQCNPALTLSVSSQQCNVECHLKQALHRRCKGGCQKKEQKMKTEEGVHPESLIEITLQ